MCGHNKPILISASIPGLGANRVYISPVTLYTLCDYEMKVDDRIVIKYFTAVI